MTCIIVIIIAPLVNLSFRPVQMPLSVGSKSIPFQFISIASAGIVGSIIRNSMYSSSVYTVREYRMSKLYGLEIRW